MRNKDNFSWTSLNEREENEISRHYLRKNLNISGAVVIAIFVFVLAKIILKETGINCSEFYPEFVLLVLAFIGLCAFAKTKFFLYKIRKGLFGKSFEEAVKARRILDGFIDMTGI